MIQKSIQRNEGKSVVERFIRTLKNKTCKHMAALSRNMYIDKLDIVNKQNNTYHRTIKMKPIEVKNNTYIDSIKEVNDILKYFMKKNNMTQKMFTFIEKCLL